MPIMLIVLYSSEECLFHCTKTKEILTLDEVSNILTLLDDVPIKWKTCLHIILHTGITRGELLGLEWKDFDETNNALYISQSSQVVPNYGIIEVCGDYFKSKQKIPLSKQMLLLVHQYKCWQLDEICLAGSEWQDTIVITHQDGSREKRKNDRLFTQKDGNPMNPDSLTDWIKKFCARTGIKRFNLNMLRNPEIQARMAENMIQYGNPTQTEMILPY